MKKQTLVLETSWEACTQIGGIYTFLQSRQRAMKAKYGNDYLLVGPLQGKKMPDGFLRASGQNFQPAISDAVEKMNAQGFGVVYGSYLTGQASVQVVLFDLHVVKEMENQIKHRFWKDYGVDLLYCSELVTRVLVFGELFRHFVGHLSDSLTHEWDVLIHFHEWLSAASLPALTQSQLPLITVFTTHATVLGRYVMPHVGYAREELYKINPVDQALTFGIGPEVAIERNAVQQAHVVTTVSDDTARECEVFFGRKADHVIPNGIDPWAFKPVDQPFVDSNRVRLQAFLKSYFCPYYHLPAEKVVCLIASGRYEFQNKGFDVLLKAAGLLNEKLKSNDSDLKVVLFLITPQENNGLDPAVVESKSRFQDIRNISMKISARVGGEVYKNVTFRGSHVLPDLNRFVDDDLLLQWKRMLKEFKKEGPAPLSTHLNRDGNEVIASCKSYGLLNRAEDPVKVIYHPDFVKTPFSPIGMDYDELLSACDVGVFPSAYEPWGYAAVESALVGLETVVGENTGFFRYLNQKNSRLENVHGLISGATDLRSRELSHILSDLSIKCVHTKRKALPNSYLLSELDWIDLQGHYQQAYQLAASRKFSASGLY